MLNAGDQADWNHRSCIPDQQSSEGASEPVRCPAASGSSGAVSVRPKSTSGADSRDWRILRTGSKDSAENHSGSDPDGATVEAGQGVGRKCCAAPPSRHQLHRLPAIGPAHRRNVRLVGCARPSQSKRATRKQNHRLLSTEVNSDPVSRISRVTVSRRPDRKQLAQLRQFINHHSRSAQASDRCLPSLVPGSHRHQQATMPSTALGMGS